MHLAPHRGEPVLSTVSADELEDYARAVNLGFHSDFNAEEFEVDKQVVDPARSFGFRVGDRWVATALSHARTMAVPGGTVGVAGVTEVTVAPGYRRRGLLRKMMHHQLTEIAAGGKESLALLWASESLIYGRFGYGQTTRMSNLSGLTREITFHKEVDLGSGSADEVSKEEFLEVAPVLRERMFADRPGHLARDDAWWTLVLNDPERWRRGAGPRRYALHFAEDGTPDGYATFRIKRESSITDQGSEVVINELDALTPDAYAGLWRWLLDLDLVRGFSRGAAPVDEPLHQLAANPRMIKTTVGDATYARIVDVPGALGARSYQIDLDLVIEVQDAFLPDSGGRFRLQGGLDGGSATRTDASPDVTLTARQLGAIYLGGTTAQEFARAGLIDEHTPGAVRRMTLGFGSDRAPFCPDFF